MSADRFTLQDFDRFDLISHEVGLCIAATVYVSDACVESDAAPDLIVRVTYAVEARRVHDAFALGLLTRDGAMLPFTDPELVTELTAWATRNLELFKRCEQRWALELETIANENALIEGGDRHVA